MKPVLRTWILAIIAVARTSAAHGATIDLRSAIQLAEKNNPSVGIASADVVESGYGVDLARSRFYPNLRFGTSLATSRASSAVFSLTQMLYDGGASLAELDVAKIQSKSSLNDLEISKEMIRLRTAEAYYNALYTRARLGYYQNLAKSLTELLDKSRLANKLKHMGSDSLVRVELGTDEASSLMIQNSSQLERDINALSLLTGQANLSAQDLSEPFAVKSMERIDAKKIKQQVLAHSYTLRGLQLAQETLDAKRQVELAAYKPTITVSANAGFSGRNSDDLLYVNQFETTRFAAGGAISLTLPLFSGFSGIATRNIHIEEEKKLALKRKLTYENIVVEIENNLIALEKIQERMGTLDAHLLKGRSVYESRKEAMKAGVLPVDYWLLVLRDLDRLELEKMRQVYDYLAVSAAVKILAGTDKK